MASLKSSGKSLVKSIVKSLPGARWAIDRLRGKRDERLPEWGYYRPGHYYSTIPSQDEVEKHAGRIFDRSIRELPGVDLNVAGQLEMLQQLAPFVAEHPFREEPGDGLRYYSNNEFFGYSSGIFLFCMLRHLRPARVVEIGSGFSSCVMLDTNERFFANRMELTLIEPHPERLRSRLKEGDLERITLLARPLQETPLACFEALSKNDVLFVDSSHVSKVGSDVNHIFFEILPRLMPGVFVHFHDIFYPFEYPRDWIDRGWYWNEDYLMRAFLSFNRDFKIVFWTHLLGTLHPDKVAAAVPRVGEGFGSSLWLERL
jgi:predicted O-methyltransferase YrrM